jgi:hypothetical protein
LTLRTLLVVAHLGKGRLPDVHVRRATAVLVLNRALQ